MKEATEERIVENIADTSLAAMVEIADLTRANFRRAISPKINETTMKMAVAIEGEGHAECARGKSGIKKRTQPNDAADAIDDHVDTKISLENQSR